MTENEYLEETEGEVLAKEAASQSPFDGTGRPFNDDQLATSEFYYHDNPANNVGPYAGPSSYSINTVAPYQPPHSGEEDPGQNVGPYNPPGHLPATTDGDHDEDDLPANVGQGDTDSDLKTAYKHWNESQWFDGTSRSIYTRAIEADQIRRQAHLSGNYEITDELTEQIEILNKTAAEYDDSSLVELMDSMPGGTVALEYDDLVDGGLVDITSFLSVGAHAVAKESANYDWDAFKTEGARNWILNKIEYNPGLLRHEGLARQSAVEYAKDKTMVLMDPIRRADIIDAFVTAAERFRREAAHRLLEDEEATAERRARAEAARLAQVKGEVAQTYEEYMPGEYTYLDPDFTAEGYMNIGIDDGTHFYTEAKAVLDQTVGRDWAEFTTDGAREWFYSKAMDSRAMLKHADITYLAAKKYAGEQVGIVPDEALKKEVVRAFTESVEFLRQATEHREGFAREASDTTFEDIYGEEDEILW